MQYALTFIAGLAVGLVVIYPNINQSKLSLIATQENLDNCQQQLVLSEAKLNGMLMNK